MLVVSFFESGSGTDGGLKSGVEGGIGSLIGEQAITDNISARKRLMEIPVARFIIEIIS